MMTHTKGPWITIHNPTNISIATGEYEDGGRQCAFVQCKSNREQARANARLIAAAPELLEALKNFCAAVRDGEQPNLLYIIQALTPADAAIAKAEGR